MNLKLELENLVVAPVTQEGFDLLEIKVSHFKKSSRIQIFIDGDNGVKLEDCARVSRAVEKVLDDEGILPGGFVLEVSSPGLDRPLHTSRDFRRRVGETVEVYFEDPAQAPLQGKLLTAGDDYIEVMMADGLRKLELTTVRMGKIIF